MGEEMLKLAERYCLALVEQHLLEMCEPIQLGCSPSGCERAIQTLQAALEANPDHAALHIDASNMYNSCDRGSSSALQVCFDDSKLALIWRVLSFAYSHPSHLLIRQGGHVVDSFLSENGGRQGDCLAGLICSRLFQSVYQSAVEDQDGKALDVTARAIMDDCSVVGSPADLLKVFDTYQRLALSHGVTVHADSCIQIPQGLPSAILVQAADNRGLKIVCGNTD